MDYEAVIAWLQEREGQEVGVLVGSPDRDELPQVVLSGELRIDDQGALFAGTSTLGEKEVVTFAVGEERTGFAVVRALLRDASLIGSGNQALKLVQEGVALAIWPHPTFDT